MAKTPRDNRIPIMMTSDELEAIEDWRFENRVATRAEAVRRLCLIARALEGPVKELSKRGSSYMDTSLDFTDYLVEHPDMEIEDRYRHLDHWFVKSVPKVAFMVGTAVKAEAISNAIRSGKSFKEADQAAEIAKSRYGKWMVDFKNIDPEREAAEDEDK